MDDDSDVGLDTLQNRGGYGVNVVTEVNGVQNNGKVQETAQSAEDRNDNGGQNNGEETAQHAEVRYY